MALLGSFFSLPCSFFDTATTYSAAEASTVASSDAPDDLTPEAPAAGAADPALASSLQRLAVSEERRAGVWSETGATCISCSIGAGLQQSGFASIVEQRAHFRSDWHRYNVRRRLAKQPCVTEEAWEKLIDADSEMSSLSGSASDDSDAPPSTTAATLWEADEDGDKQAGDGDAGRNAVLKAQGGPRCVFRTAEDQPFAVWRCLLTPETTRHGAADGALLEELRRLRRVGGTWVVLLLVGGNFAAAVFRTTGALPRTAQPVAAPPAAAPAAGPAQAGEKAAEAKPGGAAGARAVGSREAREAAKADAYRDSAALEGFSVVAHKTFHRYVVRAKGGGKQSTKDGTGKVARSAGSRMRRYNEEALDRDIQELLASWREHLDAASLVFAHAPSSNLKSLFPTALPAAQRQPMPGSAAAGGSGTGCVPFAGAKDPRLRRVPFMMRRPTHSEVLRVLRVLATVFEPDAVACAQLHDGEKAAAAAAAERATASDRDGAATGPKRRDNLLSARDVDGGESSEGERDMDKARRRDGDEPSTSGRQDEPPLHRAARANDGEAVAALLEGGADPGLHNTAGRPPYLVCGGKAARDAFRRFVAQEPERWDYAAAGIPSALTEGMETAQKAKEADKKAKQRAKDKERKKAADERKKAAEAAAVVTLEDQIAAAAVQAAALASRSAGSGAAGSRGRGGAPPGKVGAAAPSFATGARSRAAAPAPAAAQLTPAQMAARREAAAAAAEARMQSLTQAAAQQKLW